MADNLLLTLGIDASQIQSGIKEAARSLDVLDNKANALTNTFKITAASVATLGAALAGVAAAGIKSFMGWGEQLDDLTKMFGGSRETVASFAVGLNRMGLSVDEGTAGFSQFTRQLQATKNDLAKAGEASATAREQIADVAAALGDQRVVIADDTRMRIADIESSLADNIEQMQAGLADRLQSIQDERIKSEKAMEKSLSDLTYNTRNALMNAHDARSRRQIRQDAIRRQAEIIQANADKQAELNAQESKERAKEKRDEERANKLAQKQIDAAEKVAAKQIEAAEKAANKQMAAMDKVLKKQQALTTSQTPFLKALDMIGVKFSDIDGKDFYEQMAIIMDAFKKLPEGTKASAAALDLFGKSGFKWIEFLRSERGDWQSTAKDFGLIVDGEKAHEFSVALNTLGLAFTGLGVTIGQVVLPYAKDFVKMMTSIIRDITPQLKDAIQRLLTAFQKGGLAGFFKQLGEEFKGIKDNKDVQKGMKSAGQYISDFLGEAFKEIIATATWIGDRLNELIKKFNDWLGTDESKKAIKDFTQKTVTNITEALKTIFKVGKEVYDTMNSFSQSIIDWVNKGGGKEKLKSVAKSIAWGLWDGLTAELPKIDWGSLIVNSIKASVNNNPLVKTGNFIEGLLGFNVSDYLPGGKYVKNPFDEMKKILGFATGGMIPDTGIYQLHAGEIVLNQAQQKSVAQAINGQTYNITIAPTFNGAVDRNTSGSMVDTLRNLVHDEIANVMRR